MFEYTSKYALSALLPWQLNFSKNCATDRATAPLNKRNKGRGLVAPSPLLPLLSCPKVATMNLPWVLGAAHEGDCVVIQLVGAVLRSGKQALGAGCFALLRWDGRVVGRTPVSHDVHEPSWHEQVCGVCRL